MVTFDIANDQLSWTPVTGQLQALSDLTKSQRTHLLALGVSCLWTLALSIALVLGTEWLLKSEKIIFGL